MNSQASNKSFARLTARERITQVVETWFLTEPLLFAAWTIHDVQPQPHIETVRVARGKVEFNPMFILSLRRDQLREVLTFEAMRILLGHPYERRKPNPDLSYMASNLTVQECVRTNLPIPRAKDIFGSDEFSDQYFEFYYRELFERQQKDEPDEQPPEQREDKLQNNDRDEASTNDSSDPATDLTQASEDEANSDAELDLSQRDKTNDATDADSSSPESESGSSDGTEKGSVPLQRYADAEQVGTENAAQWDSDELLKDEINAAVREAAETSGWGSIGGSAKEQLLATLNPVMDYRGVLRLFRQNVLSVRRRLTRMKPSRRYGFAQMGSRYDVTTKLLFAVDVSGSMSRSDLQLGFSVVGKFFRYGVESVDVLWFDEELRSEAVTIRRARRQFEITGRGGTNFQPVMDYIDQHPNYDGLIIFTDGYAPVPQKPQNARTKVLWLFRDEHTYQKMNAALKGFGKSAYIHSERSKPRQSLSPFTP
ncbi:VWA-like domain-containing protein [Stieleria sp. JC731]|uniref:VWA-like domain-containing protein n=1 Tax=Pirellulaceae TaxID=2691357 RepID=UPI001E62C8C9|nr:VWA-like domain-containing protein [Stieleria sp. JC731]MCC9601071.1 VWA-like domain-containing protein [Stieleria sp. JC731]